MEDIVFLETKPNLFPFVFFLQTMGYIWENFNRWKERVFVYVTETETCLLAACYKTI